MKNVFFKREDALHKPSIFRQKKRFILIVFLVCAMLFFFYQILFMSQLSKSELIVVEKEKTKSIHHTSKASVMQLTDVFDGIGLIRGTRLSDLSKYKPNSNGKFTCFKSRMEIDYFLLNDDYCDCPEDGSDEPGTNACNDGIFYCKYQPKHRRIKENVIPSSRVNDGICDCCDGSDEWNKTSISQALPLNIQKKLGRYQVPCPNVCL